MEPSPSPELLLESLVRRVEAGERTKYVFFWSHAKDQAGIGASCLSQWYEASFTLDGILYRTAEHYMMAEKATLFADLEMKERILTADNPGAVKDLGRRVRGFDEATWKKHRFDVAVRGNYANFDQNIELKRFLQSTGKRVLVEASPVDPIWGIGLAANDPRASDPQRWPGLNLLGFALMQVRDGA